MQICGDICWHLQAHLPPVLEPTPKKGKATAPRSPSKPVANRRSGPAGLKRGRKDISEPEGAASCDNSRPAAKRTRCSAPRGAKAGLKRSLREMSLPKSTSCDDSMDDVPLRQVAAKRRAMSPCPTGIQHPSASPHEAAAGRLQGLIAEHAVEDTSCGNSAAEDSPCKPAAKRPPGAAPKGGRPSAAGTSQGDSIAHASPCKPAGQQSRRGRAPAAAIATSSEDHSHGRIQPRCRSPVHVTLARAVKEGRKTKSLSEDFGIGRAAETAEVGNLGGHADQGRPPSARLRRQTPKALQLADDPFLGATSSEQGSDRPPTHAQLAQKLQSAAAPPQQAPTASQQVAKPPFEGCKGAWSGRQTAGVIMGEEPAGSPQEGIGGDLYPPQQDGCRCKGPAAGTQAQQAPTSSVQASDSQPILSPQERKRAQQMFEYPEDATCSEGLAQHPASSIAYGGDRPAGTALAGEGLAEDTPRQPTSSIAYAGDQPARMADTGGAQTATSAPPEQEPSHAVPGGWGQRSWQREGPGQGPGAGAGPPL